MPLVLLETELQDVHFYLKHIMQYKQCVPHNVSTARFSLNIVSDNNTDSDKMQKLKQFTTTCKVDYRYITQLKLQK